MSTKETLAESLKTAGVAHTQAGTFLAADGGASPETAAMNAEGNAPEAKSPLEKAQAAEIERLKMELKAAKATTGETKSARVNFAIRPSRFKALVDLADDTGTPQSVLIENAIEDIYARHFNGRALPTPAAAAEWMEERAKGGRRK